MIHIYNINNSQYNNKMAAFDYDWTLVCPKDGSTYPKDVEDYKYLYDNIKDKLKRLYEDGYMLVIFTNQTKDWKINQIQNFTKILELPIFIVIGFKDKLHNKPNLILFDTFIKDNIIDKDKSFYVGDALGRKGDWSDTDKIFADNIGIKCISPEKFFYVDIKFNIPKIPLSDNNETIIMVGYPGSGKSTIAKSIAINDKYSIISGDICKTVPKTIKCMKELFTINKSIIIDATNSSIKKREKYIELSIKNHYSIKCIHVTTSLEESYKRNKLRQNPVPKIAYSVYKKYFEEPTEKENFTLIIV